jgi:hypothetical protein
MRADRGMRRRTRHMTEAVSKQDRADVYTDSENGLKLYYHTICEYKYTKKKTRIGQYDTAILRGLPQWTQGRFDYLSDYLSEVFFHCKMYDLVQPQSRALCLASADE